MRQLRINRYNQRREHRARRNLVKTGIGEWFSEHKGVFVFLLIFGVLMGGHFLWPYQQQSYKR